MRLSACLLVFLCLNAAAAGPEAGQMTMHRQGAGEPGKSGGWILAASTEGRFSVQLPIKFNDFTVYEVPEAPAVRTYTVGARSSEQISFVATRIVYRQGATAAKRFFARFEEGRGQAAAPLSATPVQFGALRAVDLLFRGPTAVNYQRVVLLDSDLIMLSVEAPAQHDAAAKELAARFFDSLQVDAR
jgi:hypothetical protein